MVLPIFIIIGGAVVSVIVGYALDKSIGDGDYTAGEVVADATLGALGFGVLKGLAKVAGGLRYANRAKHARSAEEVATMMTTGFAVSTRGSAEVAATLTLDHAIQSALTPSIAVTPSPGGISTAVTTVLPKIPTKSGGKRVKNVKTWCRRHMKYDYCR